MIKKFSCDLDKCVLGHFWISFPFRLFRKNTFFPQVDLGFNFGVYVMFLLGLFLYSSNLLLKPISHCHSTSNEDPRSYRLERAISEACSTSGCQHQVVSIEKTIERSIFYLNHETDIQQTVQNSRR